MAKNSDKGRSGGAQKQAGAQQAAAPAAPAAPATKNGKGRISDESRASASFSRRVGALVNEYVRKLRDGGAGGISDRKAKRLAEIEAELSSGQREKKIPVFVEGAPGEKKRRDGTKPGLLPLTPIERADLIAERARLQAGGGSGSRAKKLAQLRAEVLAALPEFARRKGWDRAILIEIGIPAADLDACGMPDPSAAPPAAPPA